LKISFLETKKERLPANREALYVSLIGLVFICDEITQGLMIEFGTAIIAKFLDVIPHITPAEMHPTSIRSVLMSALCLLEHLQKVCQVDPFPTLASTFAHLTGSIAGVGFAFRVGNFAYGHVGFAVAVWAAI
jgi:hypothetical protein